jgi:hypothetical protein
VTDDALRFLSAALSLTVASVALRMAWKGLTARGWLRFHTAAAGADFARLPPRQQALARFQVRLGGLSFLVLFLVLAGGAGSLASGASPRVAAGAALVGASYSGALGKMARRLQAETGAATPWRGAYTATFVLLAAAAVALLAD